MRGAEFLLDNRALMTIKDAIEFRAVQLVSERMRGGRTGFR
ncbi:hypothetical protein ACFWZ2_14450 [Streptomyces sp. NPDC059002]